MRSSRSALCVLVAAAGGFVVAQTAVADDVTLMGWATADNAFTAYVSTDPNSLGTAFMSGNSWPGTFTGSYVFPSAGTYYLHIVAQDFGRPEMFIGRFLLANNQGSTFLNNDWVLLTDLEHWTVSSTGLGQNMTAPEDRGVNGSGPWGFFPDMGQAARFIWAPQYTGNAFFTTVINVVPTPAAAGLFAIAAMGASRRRR